MSIEIKKNCIPPIKFEYNDFGLRTDIDYKFKEDGFIDWRAMVNPEHLTVNRQYFERFNKTVPESIEGLPDEQLLIKLQGLKDLLKFRQYLNLYQDPVHISENNVTVKTTIEWAPNYETNNKSITFESIADATPNNASGFGTNYLATIAENRSLCRCIRNFLGINVCSVEEVGNTKGNKPQNSSNNDVAYGVLNELLTQNGRKFENLKNVLIKEGIFTADEESKILAVEDIPKDKILTVIEFTKKKLKETKK